MKFVQEGTLPYFLIAIYAVSITPSLQIPYLIDDMDHLFQLARSMETSNVLQWIFTPHNEHAIPFLKLLYYLCYKYSWLHPQAFHLAIIAVCIAIMNISYRLLLKLTNSKWAAFIGIAFLALTNLPDMAIFITTNSHIIFCLFFLMLLFYAQYEYCTHKARLWIVLIMTSTILAPATFALGILSIIFAFLFERLCIPRELRSKNGSSMMYVLIGWSIGLIPYLLTWKMIIYSDQYNFVGASSSFQAMNIWVGTKMLVLYFYHDLIPGLFPNLYLSMGVFFFAITLSLTHRKSIDWKRIVFFLIAGFTFSFIIYIFRAAWGPDYVSVSRYSVFPSLMLCMVYIILLTPFIKEREASMNEPVKATLIYGCIFLCLSYSSMLRYEKAERVANETNVTIQKFNIEFKEAMVNYFKDHPHVRNVTLKDNMIYVAHLPSLMTEKGFYPYPTRYPRPLSFYNQYVLPESIRGKISYAQVSDASFLNYIKSDRWQGRYESFAKLLE